MKIKLFLILALAAVANLLAEQSDTLSINYDSIDSSSIKVFDGWKYHSGDESSWADPNFDDSGWETVDARLIISDSLNIEWEGIGWFRKTIRIDSALVDNNIALIVFQYGASQIYLNGKVAHEFGKVSNSLDNEEIYQPRRIPITINLDSNLVYTFAVRYSNWRVFEDSEWYKNGFHKLDFRLVYLTQIELLNL